jgi:electron transport complex protein RnfC
MLGRTTERRDVMGIIATLTRPWAGRGTFYGGVFLPAEKTRTEHRPIESLPIPERLFVPLQHARDETTSPAVRAGQRVRKGDVLAAGVEPDTVRAHAPAAGVVEALATCDTPHEAAVPCAVLRTIAEDEARPATASEIASIDDLAAFAAASGVVGQGRFGSNVAARLRAAAARGCRPLLVNAVESDPCLTTDSRLLTERPGDLIAATQKLANCLGNAKAWFAVDRDRRDVLRSLRASARDAPLRIVPLLNKYPQGHPHLLIDAILHRQVPYGGIDLDVGACVINVGTLALLHGALTTGQPVTHRLLTVTGDAVLRPGNYRVALGTPIWCVLDAVGLAESPAAVIAGNPMTGIAVRRPDVVVTRRTQGIMVLGKTSANLRNIDEPPDVCTRCGWCLDDCPAGLDPAALLDAAERRDLRRAASLFVHACLGCGLCSYGCPANLPIAESIAALRRDVPPPAPRTHRTATSESAR